MALDADVIENYMKIKFKNKIFSLIFIIKFKIYMIKLRLIKLFTNS